MEIDVFFFGYIFVYSSLFSMEMFYANAYLRNNLSKVEPLDDNLRRTIELYDTPNLGQLVDRLKLARLKEDLDLFDQVKDFQKRRLILIYMYFIKSVLDCQENNDFQSFKNP